MLYFILVAVLNLLCFVEAAKVPASRDRIVGGSNANINTFPYQASLSEKGSHVCGCSIISPTHILTAAHCVDDVDPESNSLEVRAGSLKHDSGGVVKAVKSFKIHPLYNSETMDYDLAVLSLKSAFIFSSSIKKIDLADAPPVDGSEATVSGWGLTENNGKNLSPTLKFVKLIILSKESCTKTGYGRNIRDSMFCAKGKGTDACEGDSGGPMVNEENKQIGVVSFGFDCASEKYPGVYTLVSKCLDFIGKMMKTL